MRTSSIFRIYSMTKPIVSVAAMILVEEGKLQLSDPVSLHIPELKGLKVGVEKGDGLDLVAAAREPTVHDIFRHTSGFTYGVFGKNMVKEQYQTAADYLRFAQMMLNGGELNGVRILSRKTVEYMTTDHLGAVRGPTYLPGPGYGFGLGVAVRLTDGQAATPGSAGDYNWGGLGGTYFWVDPKEKLIAIWMMQAPGQRTYYRGLYRDMVYGAMVQ